MASALLLKLAEKIRLAAAEIHTLRKDRERLMAEVALMEEESRRARKLLREHGDLLVEREKTRVRLEKIIGKLDKADLR